MSRIICFTAPHSKWDIATACVCVCSLLKFASHLEYNYYIIMQPIHGPGKNSHLCSVPCKATRFDSSVPSWSTTGLLMGWFAAWKITNLATPQPSLVHYGAKIYRFLVKQNKAMLGLRKIKSTKRGQWWRRTRLTYLSNVMTIWRHRQWMVTDFAMHHFVVDKTWFSLHIAFVLWKGDVMTL